MNILITGKSGYIAKALQKKLHDKHNITCIGREDVLLTDSNSTQEWFRDKKFDIVLHTAVSGGSRLKQEDSSVLSDNLLMFFNLYNNREKYTKLITFGSGAQDNLKHTMYGLSKFIINKFIEDVPNFFNLIIYGVFDENELETRFIKSNIANYTNKESIIIHRNKFMDFIYMPDLLQLVEQVMSPHYNSTKIINCTYKSKTTLLDIANIINKLDLHRVDIMIQQGDLDVPYSSIGGIEDNRFIGLVQGIEQVFTKLKSRKLA